MRVCVCVCVCVRVCVCVCVGGHQVFKHMLPTRVRAHFQAAPPLKLLPGDAIELNTSNYLCFAAVFASVYAPLLEFGNDMGTAKLGD